MAGKRSSKSSPTKAAVVVAVHPTKRQHSGRQRQESTQHRRPKRSDGSAKKTNSSSPLLPRPAPPPDPPPSLIKLLQSDSQALQYFQSLQQNLTYDVQKYKLRVRQLEEVLAKLQQEAPKATKATTTRKDTTRKDTRHGKDQSNHKSNQQQDQRHLSSTTNQQTSTLQPISTLEMNLTSSPDYQETNQDDQNEQIVNQPMQRGVPIDDAMFDMDLSSSNSSFNFNEANEFDEHPKEEIVQKQQQQQQHHITDRRLQGNNDHHQDENDVDLEGSFLFLETSNKLAMKKRRLSSKMPESFYLPVQRPEFTNANTLQPRKERPVDNSPSHVQLYRTIESRLFEAQECLQHLGITLIETNTDHSSDKQEGTISQRPDTTLTDNNNNNPDPEPNPSTTTTTKSVIQRRSDSSVIDDLVRVLRALIKVKRFPSDVPFVNWNPSDYGHDDDDFKTRQTQGAYNLSDGAVRGSQQNWIPCFHPSLANTQEPSHPAIQGVQDALYALVIMDAFADSKTHLALFQSSLKSSVQSPKHSSHSHQRQQEQCKMSEDEDTEDGKWEGINDRHDEDHDEKINRKQLLVGMKDRHRMVETFVLSVMGSMTKVWPVDDRSKAFGKSSMSTLEHSLFPTSYDDRNDDVAGQHDPQSREGEEQEDDDEEQKENDDTTPSALSSISHNQLSELVGRSVCAYLVTKILLVRNDATRAAQLFWSYVVSAMPSLTLMQKDYYPNHLEPVLSFCIIEAMLVIPTQGRRVRFGSMQEPGTITTATSAGISTLQQDCSDWLGKILAPNKDKSLARLLSLVIHGTALIYELREQRSEKTAIRDIARVELAAYQRLLVSKQSWLHKRGSSLTNLSELQSGLHDPLFNAADTDALEPGSRRTAQVIGELQLAMILNGDSKVIRTIFDHALKSVKELCSSLDENRDIKRLWEASLSRLLACCLSQKQLEIRQLDLLYRPLVESPSTSSPPNDSALTLTKQLAALFAIEDNSVNPPSLNTKIWTLFSTSLLCCREIADGESAISALEWILHHCDSYRMGEDTAKYVDDDASINLGEMCDAFQRVATMPTVRIINLERRKDRMAAFLAQAMLSGLLVVRGVTVFGSTSLIGDNEECQQHRHHYGHSCGCYAVDGKGRSAEVEERIRQWVGKGFDSVSHRLDQLVQDKWNPHVLRLFDTEAPNADIHVRLSPSEKACALSHISSWNGVLRSLVGELREAKAWYYDEAESKRGTQCC